LPECEVLAPQVTVQHQQMDGLLKEAAQQVCNNFSFLEVSELMCVSISGRLALLLAL
jgi:hypothetical protein